MKKKLIRISFFLLLAALFTFLECQIDKEVEKIEEPEVHNCIE